MTELAERARGLPDARVRCLIDWIREQHVPGPARPGNASRAPAQWNDQRVIIFTEYDDTKRYLEQQLAAAIDGTDRARRAHRDLPRRHARRARARRSSARSTPTRQKHPLRILIATDAAREGLNLQSHCCGPLPLRRAVEPEPHGAAQRPHRPQAPARRRGALPLLRLRAARPRTASSRCWSRRRRRSSRSSAASPRSSRPTRAPAQARHPAPRRPTQLAQEIETRRPGRRRSADASRRNSKAARERQDELWRRRSTRCASMLEQSRDWHRPGRGPASATRLSCVLELLGAEPLKPSRRRADGSRVRGSRPSTSAPGADPTWADTLDTLRAPGSEDQKLWEWRRSARSGRWSSRTRAPSTTTSSTCTSSIASSSACSAASARASSTTTCRAPASPRRPTPSRASSCSAALASTAPARPGCTRSWSRSRRAGSIRRMRNGSPHALRPRGRDQDARTCWSGARCEPRATDVPARPSSSSSRPRRRATSQELCPHLQHARPRSCATTPKQARERGRAKRRTCARSSRRSSKRIARRAATRRRGASSSLLGLRRGGAAAA